MPSHPIKTAVNPARRASLKSLPASAGPSREVEELPASRIERSHIPASDEFNLCDRTRPLPSSILPRYQHFVIPLSPSTIPFALHLTGRIFVVTVAKLPELPSDLLNFLPRLQSYQPRRIALPPLDWATRRNPTATMPPKKAKQRPSGAGAAAAASPRPRGRPPAGGAAAAARQQRQSDVQRTLRPNLPPHLVVVVDCRVY
jgi:hypothetical protein